ncbi:MAG TPA: vWA domain-containing protein, partial [Anaerolineales bacterium]|nr:vWA domain-containing protein [Anaerolineales bacterium]
MRRASMDLRSEFGLFLTVLLSVLLLALFLSLPEGMGLAAPSTLIVPPIPAEFAEHQDDIPYCGTPPEGCNKIQVIVMIDQSGSISVNDPKRLRFSGAENLVKLLAYRYLEAGESQTVAPTIQLSVLHFGSSVLPYDPEWITIAPKSQEDWEAQFKDLKTKISPEGLRRGEATNFIRPFEAARNLLEQASPQDGQGCPRRLILLLTDGAPAAAQVFRGPILKAHMDRVTKIAGEGMSGKGNFIYVTAFNVIGDNYWAETRKYWEQITCPANADPPCSNDLPRAKRENTANDVAIRMQNIIATHLGYQYQSFSLRAEPVILPVSAYVQSLRLSYYAPDPTAKFTMVDPDGKTVEPDGENVIFDDQDPLVQVLSIKAPKPGNYEITSETGGTVTLLPTYSELTPKIEVSPSA